MKLGAKLRVSYIGIVLVAVAITLILIIENAQKELKEKIGSDLRTVSELAAGDIVDYVDGKILDMINFSRSPVFKTGKRTAIKDRLNEIKKKNPGFDDILVLDLNRKVALSTAPGFEGNILPVHDKEIIDYFEKVKLTRKGNIFFKFISGDEQGNILGGLIFAPVIGEDKKDIRSVLMATVSMERLLKPVGRFEVREIGGRTAYLLNNPSQMIVTQEGRAQIFTPLVYMQDDSLLLSSLKGRRNGYTIYKDTRGNAVIAGYAHLSEYGLKQYGNWAVISVAPEKEVFSPPIRLRNKMIVLGGIAVIVAWILAFFLAKGITSPIIRLVNVTDLIARGDLSQRTDIRQGDEVGELAAHFNKMTHELNLVIALRDQEIIERKNAEERLKEEMDARGRFISLISLEVRTPLAAIKEGMDVVLSEASKKMNDRQRGILELTKRSMESLANLIDDIVDHNKLESDKDELKMDENSINEVVANVHRIMLPLLAERKNVKLIVETDQGLPKFRFDRNRITLVLTNIVNMAINVTEKGSITVMTAREGEKAIRVSVKDTGAGIKREDLPLLFDKFAHPGKSRDKKAGGTGLGLAICKAIIDGHNGIIWAESEGKKGTIFNFILPLQE